MKEHLHTVRQVRNLKVGEAMLGCKIGGWEREIGFERVFETPFTLARAFVQNGNVNRFKNQSRVINETSIVDVFTIHSHPL